MKLIITESPTKARFISKILPKGDYKIISCYGRILDLDPINSDQYINGERLSWTATNPENISFIQKQSKSASKIFIATDPDIEGEVIAWQLSMLFESQEISAENISRIHFEELTLKGINNALLSPHKLDIEKAHSGISRRIFDNFSQFTFDNETLSSKPYISGSSSRISAPLLESISKNPLITHTIKFQRPGMPIPVYLEINSDHDHQKICRTIERLPNPVLKEKIKDTEAKENEGLDFKRLLLKSLEVTNNSQEEIYDSLQNLYIKGKITYFRTDSTNLNLSSKKIIKKEIESMGATNLKLPEYKKSPGIQEGHFAIAPLVSIDGLLNDFEKFSLEEKLLSVIWRYYILNTQDRVIETTRGILDENAFENIGWLKLFKELNGRIEHKKISNNKGAYKDFDEILKPLGITRKNIEGNEAIKIIKHSRSESIINRMIKLDIGRPSTLVKHSKKITSKFINEKLQLNNRGLSALIENHKKNNRLLDINVSKKIEQRLHAYNGQSIEERIYEAINNLGSSNSIQNKPREHQNYFNWGI